MAVPALVIGIGGTGQWVLTHLKKNLIETQGQMPAGVKLLAIDLDCLDMPVAGDISLKPPELVCLGSNLRDLLNEVVQTGRREQLSHIRSWLKTDDYVSLAPIENSDPERSNNWQSRQLARLAIFQDLQHPETSKVLTRLKGSIQQIQRETNAYRLPVFLAGSLAGVTGTGMFLDLAYLVRQIARDLCHQPVMISGIFVLPEAFSAALSDAYLGWRDSMTVRAFAAMRETERFSVCFDWDLGYPMHYVAPTLSRASDPVLLGSIKGKPFDHLYYLDGQRKRFPLNVFPVEKGIVPTIADMLSVLLDENFCGPFEEHVRNLQAVLASRGHVYHTADCGSFGVYSIVLPIHHIIEGYAHRLCLEALGYLLQPTMIDSHTDLPTHLAGDRNAEAGEGYTGADAARAFMTSKAINDPEVATKVVDNTLFTADLVGFTERLAVGDMSVIGRLVERSIREWELILTPTDHSEDTLKLRSEVEAVFNMSLERPSDRPFSLKLARGNATETRIVRDHSVNRILGIENTVCVYKNVYLGAEQEETRQRLGGMYREALDKCAAIHLNRFQTMLAYKMSEVLNGRSNADPILAKSGKLGHLQDFLQGVSSYLDRGYQIMRRVTEHRRCLPKGRAQAWANAQYALSHMKSNATNTRPIIGKAHKSQDAYLEAEQILIDIHKVEIMEQAVTDTIKQMQEMVASAKASADAWAQTLGIGQGSLYAALLSGKRQVDANRDKDADVESRLVLGARKAGREEDAEYKRFREYEERRYRHYVYEGQANQVAKLLGDLHWQVSIEEKAGKPAFKLGLSMASEGAPKPSNLDDNAGKNLGLILSRARQAFQDARQDESVVEYLVSVYRSPEELADLIYEHSEALLDHDATGPIPAIYLQVAYEQKLEQVDYLRGMLRRLASRSNITDMDRFAKLVNSENRFTCTLVHTLDLIEMDRLAAYQNGLRNYLSLMGSGESRRSLRATLHCFPAEINAAEFEERLLFLNQAPRMLHHDIALQLENVERLRLFLLSWGYRLINTYAFDDVGQMKHVYRLQWDTDDGRDSAEVWLTRPQKDKAPDFLEALMTFNYAGRDVGHGDAYFKPIKWDRVKATLEQRYREDMTTRRAEGTLGASDPALRSWLEAQHVQEDPVWFQVARLDRLSEMDKKLAEMVVGLDERLRHSTYHDHDDLQQQYDLASVFLLILLDGQKKLSQGIRDRQIEIRSGLVGLKDEI